MSVRVMIAAGGTGGHLIPALSVAGELMRRGHVVTTVTTGAALCLPAGSATFRCVR